MTPANRRRLALTALGCGAALAFAGCAAPQQHTAPPPSTEATPTANATPEPTAGPSGGLGSHWPDGIPKPDGEVVAEEREGSTSTIVVVMPDANAIEDYMAELEAAGFERVEGVAAPDDPETTAFRTNTHTVTILDASTSTETRIVVTEALHIP